ncbi:MAG: hypothetical protein H0W64_10590 [Gammaproteobacteria bacterium]|nr:hypothetical protein [Gammaproteobacteria bacterium]
MQAQKEHFHFTFANLESHFELALSLGYEVLRCQDYLERKMTTHSKLLVNRVDIDVSVKKAERIANIFNKLGIKATFFVRLHANEYNPFSFENYRILKYIKETGHEIGYHSEVNDEAVIWNEDATHCLWRDIDILNRIFDIKITGVASHGGMTGLNNLDFWKDKKPRDFNLGYEAYDTEPEFDLFHNSLYVSDSCWTYWKCYNNGKLIENDHRNLGDHLKQGKPLVYSLIHPENYFNHHFYE